MGWFPGMGTVLFRDYANSLAPASFAIAYKLNRRTRLLEKACVTKGPASRPQGEIRRAKLCLARSLIQSLFGEGEQFGRSFEAENLRGPEIASVVCSSPRATAHPDLEARVIWTAATFAFGWAERSTASLLPTMISTAART